MQIKGKQLSIAWAREVAKENPWFDRVLKSQIAFEALWRDAAHYRNVVAQ